MTLLETGFRVTVRAHRSAPNTTSAVAAALWYPYAVGGVDVPNLAIDTLRRYREVSSYAGSGVGLLPCTSYVPADSGLPFWASEKVDFEPIDGGFRATLPVADSDLFLQWLTNRIEALGGSLHINPRAVADFNEIGCDTIVNCTGLGSRQLCDDTRLFPIKGSVVLVENPGIDYCLTDDRDLDVPTYFVPVSEGLVLGGNAQKGNADVDTDPGIVDDIIERCAAFEPELREAPVLKTKSGLRPGRDEVRLEREETASGKTIVHNYGHGGSGYTLAWGCANEVVRLLEQ